MVKTTIQVTVEAGTTQKLLQAALMAVTHVNQVEYFEDSGVLDIVANLPTGTTSYEFAQETIEKVPGVKSAKVMRSEEI